MDGDPLRGYNSDCRFDGIPTARTSAYFHNCSTKGQNPRNVNNAEATIVLAGECYTTAINMGGGNLGFDLDAIVTNMASISVGAGGVIFLGLVGFFSVTAINIGNVNVGPASALVGPVFGASAVCWGDSGAWRVHYGSVIAVAAAQTYANTFQNATTFTLGGQSLAAAYVRATGVWTGNIATTWANADTNVSLSDPISNSLVCKAA